MEILFIVKQLITLILFFMNVNNRTNKVIKTMMNMLMLEYPELQDVSLHDIQRGGGDAVGGPPPPMGAPQPMGALQQGIKVTAAKTLADGTTAAAAASEAKADARAAAEKAAFIAEDIAEKKKPLSEQLKNKRELTSIANTEATEAAAADKIKGDAYTATKKGLTDSKNKLNAASQAYKTAKRKGGDIPPEITKRLADARTAVDGATKANETALKAKTTSHQAAKNAKNKAFNRKTDQAKIQNKNFEENNPDFGKFMKAGPIQGTYKIVQDAVKTVVTFVKMFFYFIYKKSMMTFLPFIMTMSVAFSIIRYMFQNVRNG